MSPGLIGNATFEMWSTQLFKASIIFSSIYIHLYKYIYISEWHKQTKIWFIIENMQTSQILMIHSVN